MHERDVADDIGQLDSGRFSLLGRQDLDRDQTVRRAFIVPLQLRMFRDDGWHADWFWLRFALFVLAEAALIFPFLETRLSLWWSFVPGFALAGWLGYHLLPGYANPVVSRHAMWLIQALALLCANAAVRSIRSEEFEYREFRRRGDVRSAPP